LLVSSFLCHLCFHDVGLKNWYVGRASPSGALDTLNPQILQFNYLKEILGPPNKFWKLQNEVFSCSSRKILTSLIGFLAFDKPKSLRVEINV
jgi:hypothetical protein